MGMNVVFLMDPLESVNPAKDTTLMLMIGAKRRGHSVFFLPDGGITLSDGELLFRAVPASPNLGKMPPFDTGEPTILKQQEVGAVFIRTDPPFNERYLMNTWLLERLPGSIPVINSPAGIRTVNEKIWAAQFTSIIPRTLITRDMEACRIFVSEEKNAIVKPTDGFGGRSVFHISQGNPNLNVIIETVTRGGSTEAILQRYVAESDEGDKRILLLNGEPLGAILRVHAESDHRNNVTVGAKAKAATIAPEDERIIATLKPHLKALGLYFVGIDVIGGYLIEVNVTSPTCLQEMNRLGGRQLEERIIRAMEEMAERNK